MKIRIKATLILRVMLAQRYGLGRSQTSSVRAFVTTETVLAT